jgi:hypothetical protein
MDVPYHKKKNYLDFTLIFYLALILILGYYMTNKFFSFSNGIDIGENVEGSAKGISLSELLENGSSDVRSNILTLLY